MSRRSFLLDLKAEGALALWHDYRRGDARDMSGNGNHGTLNGDIVRLGKGYQPLSSSGHILVEDAPSNRLTEGALVAFTTSRIRRATSGRYQDLIIKRTSSTNYEMYITPTGTLGFFDGGLNSGTISCESSHYVALNIKNGEEGEIYHDGIFVQTLPGGALTVATNTSNIGITSGEPTSSQFLDFPLEAAIIVNRKLTPTEHAKLYGELANQDWGQRVL